MKSLKLFLLVSFIAVFGAYGFIQSGLFNVSALTNDGPVLNWLLHETMEKSVAKRARDIDVPDLTDPAMILAGVSDYAGMCAGCHGEPGAPDSIVRQGLNPTPPDFAYLSRAENAAEQFWVINNGIRMTGMPAFSPSHDANGIWPVVAFLQSANNLSDVKYAELKNKATGFGHHGTQSDEQSQDDTQHDHNSGTHVGSHQEPISLSSPSPDAHADHQLIEVQSASGSHAHENNSEGDEHASKAAPEKHQPHLTSKVPTPGAQSEHGHGAEHTH
ncbi:MAG: mono/diheme cytochrome c family protein [Gammaproteobacteria bacterium]|jgi:mono/diheme cytochrome c family protein